MIRQKKAKHPIGVSNRIHFLIDHLKDYLIDRKDYPNSGSNREAADETSLSVQRVNVEREDFDQTVTICTSLFGTKTVR